VAGEVECERFLDRRDAAEIILLARFRQGLDGGVRTIDIALVMLVVVELHDLSRNMRLEGTIVIGQIG
jgi:hypothetical protein